MSSTTKSGEADVPLLPPPDRLLLRRTLPNLHVGGAGAACHVASRCYRPLLGFVSSCTSFQNEVWNPPALFKGRTKSRRFAEDRNGVGSERRLSCSLSSFDVTDRDGFEAGNDFLHRIILPCSSRSSASRTPCSYPLTIFVRSATC